MNNSGAPENISRRSRAPQSSKDLGVLLSVWIVCELLPFICEGGEIFQLVNSRNYFKLSSLIPHSFSNFLGIDHPKSIWTTTCPSSDKQIKERNIPIPTLASTVPQKDTKGPPWTTGRKSLTGQKKWFGHTQQQEDLPLVRPR